MTKKRPHSISKKATDQNDTVPKDSSTFTGTTATGTISTNDVSSTTIPSILSFRSAIVIPVIVLVVYYIYSVIMIPSSSSSSSDTAQQQGMECDYYLAESTIPNAGWGIFTARPLYQNELINITNGESGIPVIDLTTEHGKYLYTLYYNYMWNADVIGSHNEGGGKTIYIRKNKTTQQQKIPGNVLSLISGIGMLTNGHPLDYNMVPYQIPIPHPPLSSTSTTETTDFALSRHSKTPTTGAITYYHHLQYFVYNHHHHRKSPHQQSNSQKVVVPAGGELIINYGTGWNTRFDFNQYRIYPPERPKQNIHSLSYLQNHGYCMDTIISSYPSVSNIVPHAGYGGLARRAIPKNTVIIPIPTIPIHRYGLHMGAINNTSDGSNKNKSQLGMDDKFDEFDPSSQTETSTSTATKIRQQLLLNYDDLGPNDTE